MIRGKTATVWSLGLVLLLRARAVGSHFEDFGISSAHKHVSGEVPKQAPDLGWAKGQGGLVAKVERCYLFLRVYSLKSKQIYFV
jgi:hypothetical protein